MRRMLDPKEAGGNLPSTITFDKDGNRKVGKNLGVDGKLTLKSLVSASNPDGDITKELGGGGSEIHGYRIRIDDTAHYITYTSKNFNYKIGESVIVNDFTTNTDYKELRTAGYYPAGGYYYDSQRNYKLVVDILEIRSSSNRVFYIKGYDLAGQSYIEDGIVVQAVRIIQLF